MGGVLGLLLGLFVNFFIKFVFHELFFGNDAYSNMDVSNNSSSNNKNHMFQKKTQAILNCAYDYKYGC